MILFLRERQGRDLQLSLNIQFSEIYDPKGICKDVTHLGRWGNGDVEVGIDSLNQVEDVMFLVKKAFEKHQEIGS